MTSFPVRSGPNYSWSSPRDFHLHLLLGDGVGEMGLESVYMKVSSGLGGSREKAAGLRFPAG